MIVYDDASTELGIKRYALDMCKKHKWTFKYNKENQGILYNRVHAFDNFEINDDDVIISIDGDDWLVHNHTILSMLDELYRTYDIWMTYGSHYQFPEMSYGINNGPLIQEVVEAKSYRETRWCYSHLRTFKYLLWKRIKDEDLRDETGNYFHVTSDLAYMYPMLEMAGKRIMHIEDPWYVYNMANPLNDHKIKLMDQMKYDRYIRKMPKYETLEV